LLRSAEAGEAGDVGSEEGGFAPFKQDFCLTSEGFAADEVSTVADLGLAKEATGAETVPWGSGGSGFWALRADLLRGGSAAGEALEASAEAVVGAIGSVLASFVLVKPRLSADLAGFGTAGGEQTMSWLSVRPALVSTGAGVEVTGAEELCGLGEHCELLDLPVPSPPLEAAVEVEELFPPPPSRGKEELRLPPRSPPPISGSLQSELPDTLDDEPNAAFCGLARVGDMKLATGVSSAASTEESKPGLT